MKLGSVLRKERERRKLTVVAVAAQFGISEDEYLKLESGDSPIEEWGPKLALIAIKLKTPTSRLISENGKSTPPGNGRAPCGELIARHREHRRLTQQQLADLLSVPVEEVRAIESGASPLEIYAPQFLRFAELVELPIFNLFYPCGLPLDQLTDYP
jgi:transcriptional regulator with XRE-family HTH domain